MKPILKVTSKVLNAFKASLDLGDLRGMVPHSEDDKIMIDAQRAYEANRTLLEDLLEIDLQVV